MSAIENLPRIRVYERDPRALKKLARYEVIGATRSIRRLSEASAEQLRDAGYLVRKLKGRER